MTVILDLLDWFSKTVDMNAILDRWRGEGSNYHPEGAAEGACYLDNFEVALGTSEDQRLYDKAVQRLFAYRYYPDSVLTAVADFARDGRLPLPGDRIVQRIKVIPYILDAITMNIVKSVWREPDSSGFTIITSERHYEVGEWTVAIDRHPNGEVALVVRIDSYPSNQLRFLARWFARALQLRAHRLARRDFAQAVLEQVSSTTAGGGTSYKDIGVPRHRSHVRARKARP